MISYKCYSPSGASPDVTTSTLKDWESKELNAGFSMMWEGALWQEAEDQARSGTSYCWACWRLHMCRGGCAAKHDAGCCLSWLGPSGHCCGTWGAAIGHDICIWCWSQRCRDGWPAERQSHLPTRACMKLAGHTRAINCPISRQQQLTGWYLYNCTSRRWQLSNNRMRHSWSSLPKIFGCLLRISRMRTSATVCSPDNRLPVKQYLWV